MQAQTPTRSQKRPDGDAAAMNKVVFRAEHGRPLHEGTSTGKRVERGVGLALDPRGASTRLFAVRASAAAVCGLG